MAVWWAFTSTTSDVEVLSGKAFFDPTKRRVIFSLNVHRAVDITRFSAVRKESERLVLAATPLKVAGVLPISPAVTMIQMEEDTGCPPLIRGFVLKVRLRAWGC